MKLFLGFVLISCVGWMLDIIAYTVLVQYFEITPLYANFISSILGVTYVWMVALNKLFERQGYGKSIYLPIYWLYQSASIFNYSVFISIVATSTTNAKISELLGLPIMLMAKILITGPNLFTNFIFMTILTKFMKPSTH